MESDFVSIPEMLANIRRLQIENEALKKLLHQILTATGTKQLQVTVEVS